MVVISLSIILQQGWNLFCIVQLKKTRVMFSAKYYSPGLLLESVNRNIRSCFAEPIAYLSEFWREAGGSISSVVTREESTGWEVLVSLWHRFEQPGSLLSSKPWHEFWCPFCHSCAANCTPQAAGCCLSVPKSCLAQMGSPRCFLVLKALEGFQKVKTRAVPRTCSISVPSDPHFKLS